MRKLTLLFVLFLLLGRTTFSSVSLAVAPEPPRLVVLVFFDQFRGDYLARWEKLYGEGGFRRLMKDGAWFQNCHYPYAYTVTAAGHASVVTGTSAYKHGMVGNDWYDRATESTINCVSSPRHPLVPPQRMTEEEKKKPKGVSPEHLLVPTVADAFKEATGGKGRVVALSWKDRSAVLPGGQRPDACYWVSLASGQVVTSTYYRERPHAWVEDFNKSKPADQWFRKEWTRLLPRLDYEKYSGDDAHDGEGKGVYQGRTFPHPMDGGPDILKSVYYGSLFNSPYGNELLLGLVKRAIDAERLGTRDTPDLLTVSFGSNDAVGHTWGPDSQEVLDITLRSDRLMKELLDHLDAKVGKGRYLLAMTADHGICPLPEVSSEEGKNSLRVPPTLLSTKAQAYLDELFVEKESKTQWIESTSGPWIYLNRRSIKKSGIKETEVQDALAEWLRKQKGIEAIYTRGELTVGVAKDDAMGQQVRRSFHPDRSGDLFVVVKPYHLLTSPLATGTSHGMPHAYDTHVPLVVFGSGVQRGVRKERVTPQATAAILARALGIKPPSGAETPVPENLFK